MDSKKIVGTILLVLSSLLIANKVLADPPFLSNEAETLDYKQWQFYTYATLTKTSIGWLVNPFAVEVDYGLTADFQLHLQVPSAANFPLNNNMRGVNAFGLGDTEAGFAYRFINNKDTGIQVAFFPLYEIPTGNASQRLGNGRPWVQLPFWIQKSWGPWLAYGGGGYVINTAPAQRNYPFGGLVVQRELNKKLSLGAEIFSQGGSSNTLAATTLLNIGGNYNFTDNFALLFGVGHNILGATTTVSYLGLTWLIGGVSPENDEEKL